MLHKENKITLYVVKFGVCKSTTVKMLIFVHLYITVDRSMERNKRRQSIFEVKRSKN
jgi:hypothetical protein